jgi:chloride channel 3/4/5
VLLATKAVGDFLGTHGIADEIIRFNGFPFLEKEDHAFNVPGALSPASIGGSLIESLAQ